MLSKYILEISGGSKQSFVLDCRTGEPEGSLEIVKALVFSSACALSNGAHSLSPLPYEQQTAGTGIEKMALALLYAFFGNDDLLKGCPQPPVPTQGAQKGCRQESEP